MESRYIALAIPAFLLLIAIELLVQKARGRVLYRFHDSITNMACGVGSLLIDFSVRGLVALGYLAVWRHARVFHVSTHSVWAWVAAAVMLDFCYYWFHRAGHRINALWAMHSVHHQSEQYNLSAALRQSWLDPTIEWIVYLPLAVVGVPLEMYLVTLTTNRLYQFWIHTRSIRRLGPLEAVLNTPSHHRVHHGIDPKYIDRNYAGVLIVWDRLFGTFQAEEEDPAYGTVKPLASWNAGWANVAEWFRIGELARGASGAWEAISAFWRPPEWRPHALGGVVVVPPVDHAKRRFYDMRVSRLVDAYVAVNCTLAIVGTAALMYVTPVIPFGVGMLGALAIAASVIGWGAMLQLRSWAVAWECARLGATALAAILLAAGAMIPRAAGIVGVALSAGLFASALATRTIGLAQPRAVP